MYIKTLSKEDINPFAREDEFVDENGRMNTKDAAFVLWRMKCFLIRSVEYKINRSENSAHAEYKKLKKEFCSLICTTNNEEEILIINSPKGNDFVYGIRDK